MMCFLLSFVNLFFRFLLFSCLFGRQKVKRGMQNAQEIKKWLKETGRSRQWLAGQLNVSLGTVNNWLSSGRPIPKWINAQLDQLMRADTQPMHAVIPHEYEDYIRVRAAELHKTIDEFVFDIIQKVLYQSELPKMRQEKAVPAIKKNKTSAYPEIDSGDLNSAEEEQEERTAPYYEAEVLGNIAAGDLMEGDSVPEPVRIYRPLQKGEYVVRVNGRSMEPTIPDGSIIVLKKYYSSDMPPVGTIVEYNDGRGVTLKRLAKRGGEYVFESINPEFPVIDPIDGGCISALYVETLPE